MTVYLAVMRNVCQVKDFVLYYSWTQERSSVVRILGHVSNCDLLITMQPVPAEVLQGASVLLAGA